MGHRGCGKRTGPPDVLPPGPPGIPVADAEAGEAACGGHRPVPLEILDDLPSTNTNELRRHRDLVEPVLAEWAVGALQIAYDSTADRIVILAEELGRTRTKRTWRAAETRAESPCAGKPSGLGEPDQLGDDLAVPGRGTWRRPPRSHPGSAALIVRVGVDLVNAGRPTCALCGDPIDPEGHRAPGQTARPTRRPEPPHVRGGSRSRAACRGAATAPSWSPSPPGRQRRRHLQARSGRAPALGFPRRPVPPRGGGLRAVGGARMGPGARDGRPRPRTARRRDRCSASSTPTSSSTTSPCSRTRRHHPALRADGRLRRRGQQRRPQRRPLPDRRRRPHLGHRPRRCASTPSPSCAR